MGCVKEIKITIYSNGYPVMQCRYTPVTPELRGIGEKLGNYLHAPKSTDLIELSQWENFEQLLERGFELLKYSVSGELLGVPLMEPGSNRGIFNMLITEDQRAVVGQVYRQGGNIAMKAEYTDPPCSALR